MLWLLLVSLPILVLSSCVTIHDGKTCSVAGRLSDGGICSHLISTDTETMTFEQFVDFLEPQPGAPNIPARGGAICMSAEDWGTMKTELEVACRELGSRCSMETKKALGILR